MHLYILYIVYIPIYLYISLCILITLIISDGRFEDKRLSDRCYMLFVVNEISWTVVIGTVLLFSTTLKWMYIPKNVVWNSDFVVIWQDILQIEKILCRLSLCSFPCVFLFCFHSSSDLFPGRLKTFGCPFDFQSVHFCSYLFLSYMHFRIINILLEFKTEETNEFLHCLIYIFSNV